MSKLSEEQREALLVSYWHQKFKEAMVAKAPYTKRWNTYMSAYNGDYFNNQGAPEYKSNLVSNYIFSIIETIRPIMLDNDPKFQSMPIQPEGRAFAEDLNEAFSYEWDREGMNPKLWRELLNCLIIGNYIFFVPWDAQEKQIRAIPVNPFNFFPDPLATNMDDGSYYIYADYFHMNELKKKFPSKASRIVGANINHSELVSDKNKDTNTDSHVLVLEIYARDFDTYEEDENGNARLKYPNGRKLTIAPELGLLLSDEHLPYKDKKFPFVHGKDYDIPGKFWGEGEVQQLLSPQVHMNELNNAVLDNAKATANMPWIVDKNAGIPKGGITNRPGLIIRKNPNSEVRREQPPGMPNYVINAIESYKGDMEQISGIFNTLKGDSETGVYTAQGILALQEAGQARIRLKVKLMEDTLGRLGQMWFSRMQQYWTEDRWIRITLADGSYDFKRLMRETFENDFTIRILAGSTMPVNRGAMLDFMIRLAQTVMPDGQALVDREAVAEYLPAEVKAALIRRTEGNNLQIEQQLEQIAQVVQQQGEQFGQAMQQLQQQDEQTLQAIEEITGALEHLNNQILQIKGESDKLIKEREQEARDSEISMNAYNTGYRDAESRLGIGEGAQAQGAMLAENDPLADGLEEKYGTDLPFPDDLLEGIEALSDDELALLLQSNPELADVIR